MVETPIRRGYEVTGSSRRHPTAWPSQPSGTLVVVLAAAAVAIGVTTRSWIAITVAAVLTAALARRPGAVVVVALLAGGGAMRSAAVWDGLAPDHLGPFEGWATVVDEPQRFPSASRVLIEIDGERHELWVRGRAQRLRVEGWQAGDHVLVNGERSPLEADRRQRVAWQHVVGTFEATWLGDVRAGGPAAVAANRVRALIERGAAVLPADQAALARGLVIGDDRDQPPEMVQRFRDSGLAHLSAVSGQSAT